MGFPPFQEMVHTQATGNTLITDWYSGNTRRFELGNIKWMIVFLVNPSWSPAYFWGNQRRESLGSWLPDWCSICQIGHRAQWLDTKFKFCQTSVNCWSAGIKAALASAWILNNSVNRCCTYCYFPKRAITSWSGPGTARTPQTFKDTGRSNIKTESTPPSSSDYSNTPATRWLVHFNFSP